MIAPDAALPVSGLRPVSGKGPVSGKRLSSGGIEVSMTPLRGEAAQEKKKLKDISIQKIRCFCISFYRRKIQGN
jgi:hypothetical protein